MADSKELYTHHCVDCHRSDGKGVTHNGFNPIAGRDAKSIYMELIQYKKGELDRYGLGIVMQMKLEEINDKKLKDIATYVSKLKP